MPCRGLAGRSDGFPYRPDCGKRDAVLLFEFVDWVVSLPEELEESLRVEIDEIEEEMKMEYITSIQRIGREEGWKACAAHSLERLVSKRFNVDRQEAAPIFAGLATEQIEELIDFFLEAESLDDIRKRADELRKASCKTEKTA